VVNIDAGNADSGTGATATLDGPISSGSGATLNGGADADTVTVNRLGTGGLTINLGGSGDAVTVNLGPTVGGAIQSTVSVLDSGATGTDKLYVTGGTALSDSFAIGAGQLTRNTTETIAYNANLEELYVDGLNETGTTGDTFTVTPSLTMKIFLDGGDPASVSPGDTLVYLTPAGQTATQTVTGADSGQIDSTGGYQTVTYQGIETLVFGGDVVVNGTGDDDHMIVTATGPDSGSYVVWTDSGSGFVAGPTVHFTGLTKLTFNGLGGDDVLTIGYAAGANFLFAPGEGVFFHGGGQNNDGNALTATYSNLRGDTLRLLAPDNKMAATVTHRLDPAGVDGHAGLITIADPSIAGGSTVIAYTGLEPVLDGLAAADRVFQFTAGAETVTLQASGDGGLDNRIGSDLSETVSFNNPSGSLSIETTATSGADAIWIQGVAADFDADLTIVAKTADSVTFQTHPTDIGAGALSATAGSIAVNANVTTGGNASLTATTSGISGSETLAANGLTARAVSGIQLNTTVATITASVSNTGSISIVETDGVTLTSVTTANGPITVSSGGPVVATSVVSSTDDDANDISITASTGDIAVGAIDAGAASGDVSLTASTGAIVDVANDSDTDITGDVLTLTAATGIGAAGNSLDLRANNLTASVTGAGPINLNESDGVILTSVSTADGPIAIVAGGAVVATSVVSAIDHDANDISITATTGDITVGVIDAGTSDGDVTLTATAGSVLDDLDNTSRITGDLVTLLALHTIGAPSGDPAVEHLDTTANRIVAMTTATGADSGIWIAEFDAVTVTSATTNHGTVVITSGGTMIATAVTAGGSGRNVRLTTSSGDIALGLVMAEGDTVLLQAAGAITDNNGATNNVNAASLALTAAAGIGAGDAIETAVSTLAAFNSTFGPIDIVNLVNGLLTIGTVDGLSGVVNEATGGTLSVSNQGALTVIDSVTAPTAEVSAHGAVTLTTMDADGRADHLTVNSNAIVRSTNGSVTVQAGDNLTLADCSTVRAAGTISLYGDYGSNDSAGSVMQLLGTLDAGAGNDNVLVFGGPQADVITVNPGGTHSADSMVIDGGEGDDRYHIYLGKLTGGLLAVTIADGGTTSGDQAFVYGTVGDDVLTVHNNDAVGTNPQTGGFVHLPERSVAEPAERVNYSASLNFLTVDGGAGNDLFHVQPSQTAVIAVEGGAPGFGPGAGDVPQVAGDTLDFDSYNNTFHIVCGTIHTNDDLALPNNGTGPFQPVHYRNIENMPLAPLGTAGPLRFDMNWTAAATQAGYTSVLPTAVYNASDPLSKFGWDAPLNGFDRGTTSFTSDFANLLRDGHWHSAPRTFIAEVESGWYLVSVKTGDKSFARDRLRVTDAR
jgi:trimeric autotransporter adhesin